MANPRIFTIPASMPFLRTLIEAMAEGRLLPGFPASGDPLALASATLYLPTRRAARLARDQCLDALGRDAAVLPRIVALGDIDEDEIAFSEAVSGPLAEQALQLPEPLGDLERKLLLAELILKWTTSEGMLADGGASLVAQSPAAALALAGDLARLMDDMTTRNVPWTKLDTLVPDHLDEYWQLTMKFLQVARDHWPRILSERGRMEPAERRDRLIEAERARIERGTAGPVIAAGSTGSMPSTAALLATIAKVPNGALVLPGLDTDLDEAAWNALGGDREGRGAVPGHPQFAMQALLRRIGVTRDMVIELQPAAAHGRESIVSEALRPAETTDQWRNRLDAADFGAKIDSALADVAMIEAGNAEEEALAVAVALREAVAEPGKTAALVTPDRELARRVLAALDRWKVPVDDSGGDRLADTADGVFARLAAEAPLDGLAPVALLALLKHPKFRLGAGEGTHARGAAALELAILRGPRPKPGCDGLAHALANFRAELEKVRRGESSSLHRSDPRVDLAEADLAAAADLVARLKIALARLEDLDSKPMPFADLAQRHRDVIEKLSHDGHASSVFVRDDTPLDNAFDEIVAHGRLSVAPADYAELFHAAIAGVTVRRSEEQVRVRIFGSLEARLQSVDRIVLGGLVEDVWPPQARPDPWLSRPMRQQLGLDLPERRTGLAAHDFAQALGNREVILARAAKLAGAPTVASRFVQRLAAVAGRERWSAVRKRGEYYLDFARALDAPAAVTPIAQPEPRPPLEARPTRLSVTEIEHWLRDPYTIYAKHVLRLAPLDPVDSEPGAADRGSVIHAAVGAFTERYRDGLPDDPLRALLDIGEKEFTALADYPEARAFWWPRFKRIAEWFTRFELERRTDVARLFAEIRGELQIPIGPHVFRLTARADRIEQRGDGSFAILDYKTGTVPTAPQVMAGLSPQLTLEAAILRGGGFKEIPAGPISELVYVALHGGADPGESSPIKFKDSDADAQADYARRRLADVAGKFLLEGEPYRSLVHPMWSTRYGIYDHLARVKEWSLGDGDTGSDGGGQ